MIIYPDVIVYKSSVSMGGSRILKRSVGAGTGVAGVTAHPLQPPLPTKTGRSPAAGNFFRFINQVRTFSAFPSIHSGMSLLSLPFSVLLLSPLSAAGLYRLS